VLFVVVILGKANWGW